ncbi:MAG: alkylhydroperoxidase, partial [Gemmatimonadaceae bacterium]|nr:alkylhydroperoxidase [Acetobacteraceae bacterium]
PHLIGQADRDARSAQGYSEADIFDIAEVTAFFNYTNRVAHAVDMMPNAEYHALGR